MQVAESVDRRREIEGDWKDWKDLGRFRKIGEIGKI